MIRVTGPDPRFTRHVRSLAWATERARRVALLAGTAEIQQRTGRGDWQAVERFEKRGNRVERRIR